MQKKVSRIRLRGFFWGPFLQFKPRIYLVGIDCKMRKKMSEKKTSLQSNPTKKIIFGRGLGQKNSSLSLLIFQKMVAFDWRKKRQSIPTNFESFGRYLGQVFPQSIPTKNIDFRASVKNMPNLDPKKSAPQDPAQILVGIDWEFFSRDRL